MKYLEMPSAPSMSLPVDSHCLASSSNDSMSSIDSTLSLTSLSSSMTSSSSSLSSSLLSPLSEPQHVSYSTHDKMTSNESWAVQCNNAGVNYYNAGRLEDAAGTFQRGLRAAHEMCCIRQLLMGNNVMSFDLGEITDPLPLSDRISCNGDKIDVGSNDTPSRRRSYLYIYQREEYDEGLDIYNDVVAVGECVELSELIATLLYNLGHALSRRSFLLSSSSKPSTCKAKDRLYLLAKQCYQQAWSVLRQSKISMSQHAPENYYTGGDCSVKKAVNIVATLHNLARLEYNHGQILEAANYAHRALDHVRLHINERRHQDLVEASDILNATGVLTFHLPNQLTYCDDGAGEKCNRTCGEVTKTTREENMRRAMAYYTEALSIRQTVTGTTDGHCARIATILNNIGRVHYVLGENDAALVVYHAALDIRRRVLGSHHLDVAATIYNAGQSYHQKGGLSAAMTLYQEFLVIAKKNLGEKHRDVAMIIKCIAQVHHERGEHDLAKAHYEKALNISRVVLGHHHPEVASVLNKLGNLFYETGNMTEALRVYNEGLEVERIVFDPTHPNIVVTITNIGQIYKIRGDHTTAIRLYKEALSIQCSTLGTEHPQTASTLASIALLYFQSKAYPEALNVYQETLRIRREAYGEDHLDVATSLNSIGLVLFKMEYHELSMQSFHHCLAIRRKLLGNFHRDVAVILYNIATVHLELGDEDEAVRYYRETLHVERQALGNSHQDVLLTMQHIASVHQQRGELEEALEYFTESLDIQLVQYQRQRIQQEEQRSRCREGPDRSESMMCDEMSIYLARTWNHIGNLYLQMGETGQMMDAYANAVRALRNAGETDIELSISGFNFYMLSKIHPPCARVA